MAATILFDLPLSAGLKNQLATARALRAGGIRCVFLSSESRASLSGFPAFSESVFADFDLHYLEDFEATGTAELPWAEGFDPTWRDTLEGRSQKVFDALRTAYGAQLDRLATALEELRPDAIALCDDGIACNTVLCQAARSRNIPIYCFPYGNGRYEDLENEIALRETTDENFSVSSPGGDLVAAHYPKWVKTGRLSGRIFMRPEVILAWESLGISLENCWAIYGSEADRFFAISPGMARNVVQEGYAEEGIELAGSALGTLIHDIMTDGDSVEAAFRQPRTLENDRFTVLIAPPPNYHANRADQTEFPQSFEAMIEALIGPFRNRPEVDLTVSPHPATAPDDRQVYDRLGISTSSDYLLELIPQHDLMVSDFSSTIAWAIACGKPVLNYDFYNFGLAVYREAPGVVTIRPHEDYRELSARFTDDRAFWREIAEQQIAVSADWGTVGPDFAAKVSDVLEKDRSARRGAG